MGNPVSATDTITEFLPESVDWKYGAQNVWITLEINYEAAEQVDTNYNTTKYNLSTFTA